jgi:hypothetical protein
MKDQDLPKIQPKVEDKKQTYEPPKATCIRVQLEERVLGCNFSTIHNCGLTE